MGFSPLIYNIEFLESREEILLLHNLYICMLFKFFDIKTINFKPILVYNTF